MGIKRWLNRVVDVVVKARYVPPPFTPTVFCLICHHRMHWLTVNESWQCSGPYKHRFTRDETPHIPLPRQPGDAGDNVGEL